MRIVRTITLLALTSLSGTLGAQTPSPASTDSARLQGAWVMLAGAANGYSLPETYVRNMRRVLTGNEVAVTVGDQLFFKATIALDPTKSPRTIDYHVTGGPTSGAVQLGIYAISGDTARFCFGAPDSARPNEFTTATGDGRTLSTWVRLER